MCTFFCGKEDTGFSEMSMSSQKVKNHCPRVYTQGQVTLQGIWHFFKFIYLFFRERERERKREREHKWGREEERES